MRCIKISILCQFDLSAYRYAYPLFRAHKRAKPQKSSHKKRLHGVFLALLLDMLLRTMMIVWGAIRARMQAMEPYAACQRWFISCIPPMNDTEAKRN